MTLLLGADILTEANTKMLPDKEEEIFTLVFWVLYEEGFPS